MRRLIFPSGEAQGEGRKSAQGCRAIDDAVTRLPPRLKCVLGRGRADVDVADDPRPAAVFLFVVRSGERIGQCHTIAPALVYSIIELHQGGRILWTQLALLALERLMMTSV